MAELFHEGILRYRPDLYALAAKLQKIKEEPAADVDGGSSETGGDGGDKYYEVGAVQVESSFPVARKAPGFSTVAPIK